MRLASAAQNCRELRLVHVGELLAEIGERVLNWSPCAAVSTAVRSVLITVSGVPLGANRPTQK